MLNADSKSITDEEIFELFRVELTKQKAFTLLVEKYQERLYWHIRRLVVHHEDTNDVMQNVFIKVWRSLENFRQESGLFTWLYRIGTNESLTFLESQKRKRSVSISDHDTGLSNKIKAEKGFDFNKLEWKLQLAIHSLPRKQQVVFNLRYYDNMPYEKMSEVLDTTVGALKASYHHAAKKVEEFILKEN